MCVSVRVRVCVCVYLPRHFLFCFVFKEMLISNTPNINRLQVLYFSFILLAKRALFHSLCLCLAEYTDTYGHCDRRADSD